MIFWKLDLGLEPLDPFLVHGVRQVQRIHPLVGNGFAVFFFALATNHFSIVVFSAIASQFGKKMCVLWQSRHDRIDKDHQGYPNVKAVQIDIVRTPKFLFVDLGNLAGFIRQGLVVFKSVALVFADPPAPFVNLHVVPAGAGLGRNKNQCGLAKGCHVIEVVLGADVLQELNRPGRVVGLFRPPGAPGKIMLHHLFGRIRQDRSLNGVVASLGTYHVAPVKGKPRGGKAPATTNIQKGMNPQDLDHILEQSGADSARIDLAEPSQVFGIALAAVTPPRFTVSSFNRGDGRLGAFPGGIPRGFTLGSHTAGATLVVIWGSLIECSIGYFIPPK
jgi:hypothetical protein